MKTKHFLLVALAALAMLFNACSMSETTIKNAVKEANKTCPIYAAPGMNITSVEYDGQYVIYNVEYDDSMYSFYESMTDVLKEALVNELQRQSLVDKSVKELLKALKDTNVGIIYRYYSTSDSLDIVLEADDL